MCLDFHIVYPFHDRIILIMKTVVVVCESYKMCSILEANAKWWSVWQVQWKWQVKQQCVNRGVKHSTTITYEDFFQFNQNLLYCGVICFYSTSHVWNNPAFKRVRIKTKRKDYCNNELCALMPLFSPFMVDTSINRKKNIRFISSLLNIHFLKEIKSRF